MATGSPHFSVAAISSVTMELYKVASLPGAHITRPDFCARHGRGKSSTAAADNPRKESSRKGRFIVLLAVLRIEFSLAERSLGPTSIPLLPGLPRNRPKGQYCPKSDA